MDYAFKFVKENRSFDLNYLANCKGLDVPRLEGVIDTNALYAGGLPGPNDGRHAVVCMDLSRVNHRSGLCRANITSSSDEESPGQLFPRWRARL